LHRLADMAYDTIIGLLSCCAFLLDEGVCDLKMESDDTVWVGLMGICAIGDISFSESAMNCFILRTYSVYRERDAEYISIEVLGQQGFP